MGAAVAPAPDPRELALALVIGVLVTWAWRGAWYALDASLLPGAPAASGAASLGCGSALFLGLERARPRLAAACALAPTRRAYAADVAYAYAALWASVGVWRGAWALADCVGGAVFGAWASHAGAVALLVSLGALRSAAAPPAVRSADASPPLLGATATPGLSAFVGEDRGRWRAPPSFPPPSARAVVDTGA